MNNPDSLQLERLACATLPDSGAFAEQIVSAHAALVVDELQTRLGSELRNVSSGLAELLRARDHLLDYETAWHPAYGGLHYAVSENPSTLGSRASAYALRLQERGATGAWSSALEPGTRLCFDLWPLAEGREVSVQATGSEVEITVRGAHALHEYRFTREDSDWQAEHAGAALDCLIDGEHRVVVFRPSELWADEVRHLAEAATGADPTHMAPHCASALRFLRAHAPAHHAWVTRVLRVVTPWAVGAHLRPSGSSSTNLAPGLVGVGNHDHAAAFADSLVHECSHHYFYIALKLGPIHDGSDSELYLNPFLGLHRPIDRILLAYHAFANVLCFCRRARSTAPADYRDYFERRTRELERGVAILEEGLCRTRALNARGLALFETVRSCVHV